MYFKNRRLNCTRKRHSAICSGRCGTFFALAEAGANAIISVSIYAEFFFFFYRLSGFILKFETSGGIFFGLPVSLRDFKLH